jgi:hypothetical protein
VFIEEAFALGDQIGHIGGILGIVFVPAAIQELAIPLHRYPGDQDDLVSLPDQMLSQGLMIVGGGLQAKDHLRQALLNLEGLGLEEELLEAFPAIVKEPSLPEGPAGGGPKEGMMTILADI